MIEKQQGIITKHQNIPTGRIQQNNVHDKIIDGINDYEYSVDRHGGVSTDQTKTDSRPPSLSAARVEFNECLQ